MLNGSPAERSERLRLYSGLIAPIGAPAEHVESILWDRWRRPELTSGHPGRRPISMTPRRRAPSRRSACPSRCSITGFHGTRLNPSVIEHRVAPAGEHHAAAVDTGHALAICRRPMLQPGLAAMSFPACATSRLRITVSRLRARNTR